MPHLFRFLRAIRRLRWKLALTAALTMIVATMAVTVAVVVQLSVADQRLIRDVDLRRPLAIEAESLGRRLAQVLAGGDGAARADRWLAARRNLCDLGLLVAIETPDGDDPNRTSHQVMVPLDSLAVAGPSGNVLTALPGAAFDRGRPLAEQVPGFAVPLVEAALDRRSGATLHRVDERHAQIPAAAPIVGDSGTVLGIVYVQSSTGPLSVSILAARVGRMLRETVPRAAPVAVIVGLLLGVLSTRGLMRRVDRLRRASAAWAKGDLGRRVDDPSRDELGQLARDLDRMAARLASVLDARYRLATLEERNRIACELHDTVKQNVFSVSMLLGSVESLLASDPPAARQLLARARDAAQQTARELTALIDQLRPDVIAADGLAAALRDHAETWSRDHGIRVSLDLTSARRLPDAFAQQLFFVAREALTNVARHSRATRVDLRLRAVSPDAGAAAHDEVKLSVGDDGAGFAREPHRPGFGLESMASRMASIGGRIEIASREGQGTTVTATCSLIEAAKAEHRTSPERGHDQAA